MLRLLVKSLVRRFASLYSNFLVEIAPMPVSLWASAGDVQEVEERLARIKADLLCEVVAVCPSSS